MKRRGKIAALAVLLLSFSLVVVGQNKNQPRPQPEKQDNKAKAKIQEMNKAMKSWLEEAAAYIITDEEKATFKRLSTDEERESFIEQFWLRRDPSADTIENEYRDEHYERIAYANERFASGQPGWKTDRGRIYIIHGKPDETEDHPAGGTYDRPFDEGGGTTSTYPFVKWTYRYIDGIGNNVELEFVDPSLSGEYRLTIDPSEKDALMYVPGAGLTNDEEMNGGDKSGRFSRSDGTRLGTDENTSMRYRQFDRLDQYAKIFKPPEIKFKDLESIVTTKLSFNLLPFDMRMDYIRVTEESVLTPVTMAIKYKDIAFQEQEGVHSCLLHVFGIITSVTGKRAGYIEQTISNRFSAAEFSRALETSAVTQKVMPLAPGLYKIDLVIKDLNSGNVGTTSTSLRVPRWPDEKLGLSSLILADRMEPISPRQLSSDQFVLGSTKVRPNVKQEFSREQNLNLWLQVYNLKIDEGSHKPSATVETLITRNGSEVAKITEEATELSGAAQQMTIMKSLPLSGYAVGDYSVQVKITDNLTKDQQVQTGKFKVR